MSPIAVLFEAVFGLHPEVGRNELIWAIRLLDEHGVDRYPFGPHATLNLRCAKRSSPEEEPVIEAVASQPVKLTIEWAGGKKSLQLEPRNH